MLLTDHTCTALYQLGVAVLNFRLVSGVNYSGRSTTIKMTGQWKVIEAGELAHGRHLRLGCLLR
jgi:hypothetical protein